MQVPPTTLIAGPVQARLTEAGGHPVGRDATETPPPVAGFEDRFERTPSMGRTLGVVSATPSPATDRVFPTRSRRHGRVRLTILHTNDVHGHFWRDERGRFGFAAQRALIERIRQEVAEAGGEVLVLSGGDINTGDPRSDVFDAEPDIRAMNLMHYDAMVLGNHEFDKPSAVLRRQSMLAAFPFLSANIYHRGTTKHAFPGYVIRDFDGFKVALVGLTTEDTPLLASPASTRRFDFRPAIDEAKRLLPALKREVDLVVVLSHLGYYPAEQHGENAPGDIALATETHGADVIVGGHTHTEMSEPDIQNGTIIVQAGKYGEHLGRLDLEVEDGRVVSSRHRLIPVVAGSGPLATAERDSKAKNGSLARGAKESALERQADFGGDSKAMSEASGRGADPRASATSSSSGVPTLELEEDPEMLALLSPFRDAAESALLRRVGRAEGEFLGKDSGAKSETALGRLVARAQRSVTRADIGIVNHGGLRSSFSTGDLDYAKVLQVQPFRNTLCTVELTAAELKEYLERIYNRAKRKLAHIDGLRIIKQGNRIDRLVVNGAPAEFSSSRRYRVVLNSYSARGGEGWPDMTTNPTFSDTFIPDALALKTYLEHQEVVRAKDFSDPSVVSMPALAVGQATRGGVSRARPTGPVRGPLGDSVTIGATPATPSLVSRAQ